MSQRSVAWSLDATVATWPQRSVANIHSMFDERYMFGYALAGIYQLLFPELREIEGFGQKKSSLFLFKNHGLVVKLHNNILEKTVDTVRKSGNAHIFNLDKPIPKRKFEEYSDIHRVQLGWTHERYESGESCPNRKERKRPDFAILEASGPKVVVDVMTTSPFTSKDRGHVRAAYFYKKLNKYKNFDDPPVKIMAVAHGGAIWDPMLWEPTSKAREKYNFELAYTSWEQVLESLNERSTSQSIKTSGTKLKKVLATIYLLFTLML
ncbi:hypothetical protein PCE1_003980 [Barthelona sp. PCE]